MARAIIEPIVGMMPEQTEYRDYRDVDGVKVPFEIIRTEVNHGKTRAAASPAG